MGVINLTPDSFSDGGRFLDPAAAVAEAGRQLARGADLLDLGAQSTRPGADEVGPDRELQRLLPALTAIRAAHPQALLSIDTFHAAVAEAALAALMAAMELLVAFLAVLAELTVVAAAVLDGVAVWVQVDHQRFVLSGTLGVVAPHRSHQLTWGHK